jgi:hypothetical protein
MKNQGFLHKRQEALKSMDIWMMENWQQEQKKACLSAGLFARH